eukprot:Gb_01317 [translate_table: standard]
MVRPSNSDSNLSMMSSQTRREIQGPRPAPLKICRDSHQIGKPALPIRPMGSRQPVIIYTKSPKIIHTEAQHFMNLVQRLTGSSSNSERKNCKNPTVDQDVDHENTSSHGPSGSISNSFEHTNACSTDASHSHSVCTEANYMDKTHESENRVSAESESHEYSVQPSSSSFSVAVADSAAASRSQYAGISLPPLSPNFLLPSPHMLSPSIFQDFPLFTPNYDNFFYSPRHFYRLSEPIFSPPQRPPSNAFPSMLSPSPTAFMDLFKTLPES